MNIGKWGRVGLSLAWLLASAAGGAAEDDLRGFTEESRRLASTLLNQVRGELVKELERTGPVRAITVCKYSVPEMTSNLSRQTGLRITRVAMRPRNPSLGEPDAWEQKTLLDFEKRLAKGEKVEVLEAVEAVQEPAGKALRYMKAIPMAQACLACHGPVSQLSEGVRAQLGVEYPGDRATEYAVGQVRGGVSVKKSLRD